MHVVHLMASPFVGGPERQVLGLARALPAGYRTSLLSFAERGLARPLLDLAGQQGIEAVELRQNFPRINRTAAEIAGHLARLNADVLCTSGYKPDLIGWRAARRARIPVVAIAHGWTGATRKVRFNEWLDALVMRWLDAVVCVSEAMAVRVKRAGVPARKIVVIRNALDVAPFDAPCPVARRNVEQYFSSPPRFIVGAVGRLSPEKGFDVLVAAAEQVARKQEVGFVLFGDGPLRQELGARVRAAGLEERFVLAGFRGDLERYLPGLDLAVSSSHTEGLPVALLEAQAAGVCVVATAVGGTPEVVLEGVTGRLVRPGDANSLADAIANALADPARPEMGQRGRQRVRDEFTFAAQAARYQELFADSPEVAMSPTEIVFWVAAAFVLYPYLVYPLYLAVASRHCARPWRPRKGFRPSVSFVLCVHNEAGRIENRLRELTGILAATGIPGEVVVVSDGSTDDTVSLVRSLTGGNVHLLELPRRGGKSAALSAGAAVATGEILVFADVRQTWAPDALEIMLENFADEQVGAVSGDLIVLSGPGAVSGVGLYWKLEKWMRRQESLLGSQVGVTGSICAVRHALFEPIPAGTMLDDVYWPLRVAMRDKRVVHDSRAFAYDRLPERAGDEFRRKVRTSAGNFQLLTRLPAALLPWRNPTWFSLLSHKLARLAVPWAVLALFVASGCAEGPLYVAALLAQVVCYGLALAGLMTQRGGRLTSTPASFAVLNAAARVAFWVWIIGRADRSWVKVAYDKKDVKAPAAPQRRASSTPA